MAGRGTNRKRFFDFFSRSDNNQSNRETKRKRLFDFFFRSDNKQSDKQLPSLHQLNSSVYEFYSPPDGISLSLEIIFVHGLEQGDYRSSYVDSWTSFLDFTCWPQTLLAEDFRGARILSVSYDSSIRKGPKQGNLDLDLTAENLVQDLIDDAKVAATKGLPVILVGKDFGGLVIKAICMEAHAQNRFTFLSNLKGVFYYGTPHLGIENLPGAFNGALAERLAFGNLEIVRLGHRFSNYRKQKWASRAILSLQGGEKIPELVISEASQRYDVDDCITPNEDIDTICKIQARTSSSFKFLKGLISRIERREVLENSPDQGKTKESVRFKTSLDFGNDESYVPMKTTLAEVKNALQRARIVVLRGGPGSGKSCLARYLALEFEVAAQQQGTGVAATCSTEQSRWLPEGVVFMTCGKRADIISLQRELLGKFDIKGPLLEDKSAVLKGAAEIQEMLRQVLVDHLSKLQFRVVVVLDDCWDSHLVENLLVPGDSVRYLLTTQISTLWNAPDLQRVQMQDVTLEDARHILGNFAKFEGGVISKDLENLADEIIEETGFHPLALATLGVVLDNMERTLEDWQDVKMNLKGYLKVEEYRPSSFGRQYSLSVDASMMLVIDLLDEDAKNLLYKITLFEGPFIPETLLRLFLTYTLPSAEKINISIPKSSLVAKGLVQIEIQEPVVFERVTRHFNLRVLRIHGLRQHFILTTKAKQICRITDFLDKDSDYKFLHLGARSDFDLATALCALYGAMDIKKRAVHKMGLHFIWSEEQSRRLASALKPFVSLMLSEGDTKNRMSQAASEVFLKYVSGRELDGDKISELLKFTDYPSAPLATLVALADIFEIEENKLIDEDHLSFLKVILSHLDSHDDVHTRVLENTPSEAPLIQDYACRALFFICKKARIEQSTVLILNVPNVLTVLVGLIQGGLAEPTEHSSLLAIYATQILTQLTFGNSKGTKLKICNAEGALAALAQSLSAHDNHSLKEYAAMALANLASGDDVDKKVKICNAEGSLAGLVQSLSAHDNHPLQEEAARALSNLAAGDVEMQLRICNAEGALTGLVQSLSAHDNHGLQEKAANALAKLAAGGEDIKLRLCNTEGALAGLVQSLSAHDNSPLQEYAAHALRNLAAGSVDKKSRISNVEGALGGLVQSLSAHDNPPLQKNAARTLSSLAEGGMEIKVRICNAEGALAGLVQSLSAHDNHPLQEYAARTLSNLAASDGKIALRICNAEGALAGLVQSLSAHNNNPLQEYVARTLSNLAAGDLETELRICNAEGALAGLVQSLSAHNNHPLQEYAAHTLRNLAAGSVNTKFRICDTEGALARLVQSLSAHDNPPLQKNAARTLSSLAEGGMEIKVRICNAEGALAGLVQSLSAHDNHPLQAYAARTLSNLAAGDVEIALRICNEEWALAGLVQSLCAHDNHFLQENAGRALSNLAAGDVEIKLRICNEEGALAGLVQSLSAQDNHPLQEYTARAFLNLTSFLHLTSAVVDTKSKICNAEGALTGLVQSLSAHDNRPQQKYAARTLSNLALGDVDTQLKICNEEGGLSGLVKLLFEQDNADVLEAAARAFINLSADDETVQLKIANENGVIECLVRALSQSDKPVLQGFAANALKNLAAGGVDTKLRICDAEGALCGLVRSLSAQDNHPLQEYTARAFVNLASAGVDTKSKICNAEGALAGLVQSLSAHDNHPLRKYAARALSNLAGADVDAQLKICNEEGALSGLVKLLAEQDNADAQEAAAWGFKNLSAEDETVRLKIANENGAIECLLRALSQSDKPVLQGFAAYALKNLAVAAGELIQLKLAEEEGAVACLVNLSEHENPKLREPATGLVATLELGREPTPLRILNGDVQERAS